MDCKRAIRRLAAHLDGELVEVEGREIQEHLGQCGACAARLDELERLRRVLRTVAVTSEGAMARPSPARPSAARLILRARTADAEEAALVRSLQRITAVAAMLLFFAGGLASWKLHGSPARTPDSSLQAVAAWQEDSHLGDLIDDENSILLALGMR